MFAEAPRRKVTSEALWYTGRDRNMAEYVQVK
jgi:hypothetical protein